MHALQYQSSRSLLSSAQWPTTCGITMQARVEWLQCLSQPRVNIWTQVLVRPVLGLPVLLHHQWLASHKPEASWYHLICRRWGWHLPIIPNPYSFSMFQLILRNYFGPYIFWYLLSNHWHHPFAKTHIEYWKLWRGILELAEVSPIPRLWVSRSFTETNMMFDDTPGMGRQGARPKVGDSRNEFVHIISGWSLLPIDSDRFLYPLVI